MIEKCTACGSTGPHWVLPEDNEHTTECGNCGNVFTPGEPAP